MDALPAELLPHRAAIVREYQYQFGIPAPLPLAAAQMAQESGFNPDAKSRTGARGLLQFMPRTADQVGTDIGWPAEPSNPAWAIRAGAYYLRQLYDQVDYPSDCDKFGAALSAYNGGMGWHNRRRAKAADPMDFWNSVRPINPGITPGNQRENETYPQRIVYTLQARFRQMGGRMVCIE